MTSRPPILLLLAALCLMVLGVDSWAAKLAETSPSVSTPQEQGEFLAGLTVPRQSTLAPLQKSPEYRDHQRKLQDQWAYCKRIRYAAMQQWATLHLSQNTSTRGIVRYLFGGPDFLNANAFFPDARILVLGGLEPVGEVPAPEALSQKDLGIALKSLSEALHTSLFCGYFITSEMKPQLVRGSFMGVLPVLYTELALTGHVINSVEFVHPFGSPGVKINYSLPGEETRTLYYFKADLSNGKECRNFLTWLGDLGPGVSYLKAASYLLPMVSFSETRNFLLKTSTLILQDDSGIPYHDFEKEVWRIQLFGVYTDPLPIFKLGRERELEEAYRSAEFTGPLSFGVGYHVNSRDANLLLAVRKVPGIPYSPTITTQSIAETMRGSPTIPKPPIKIRKALPVPVKKALPVPIRKAIPVGPPSPQLQLKSPQPVSTAYSPTVSTMPEAGTLQQSEQPAKSSKGKPID